MPDGRKPEHGIGEVVNSRIIGYSRNAAVRRPEDQFVAPLAKRVMRIAGGFHHRLSATGMAAFLQH